jgi:hypothetical protein
MLMMLTIRGIEQSRLSAFSCEFAMNFIGDAIGFVGFKEDELSIFFGYFFLYFGNQFFGGDANILSTICDEFACIFSEGGLQTFPLKLGDFEGWRFYGHGWCCWSVTRLELGDSNLCKNKGKWDVHAAINQRMEVRQQLRNFRHLHGGLICGVSCIHS